MKITEGDIARLAQLGGEAEENLRKLYEWVQAGETLLVQLWATALLAVIGALLASLFSFVSSGGPGQSWWVLVAFGAAICLVTGVVLWRWRYLAKVKEEFLIGLETYQKQLSMPPTKSSAGGER